MADQLTRDECRWSYTLPDERIEALPLVSRHEEPQIGPQEYECGCVTVEHVTARERGDTPFEMRLAFLCGTVACEVQTIKNKRLVGEVGYRG